MKLSTRPMFLAAILIVAVLTLVSCGGAPEPTPTPTPEPTPPTITSISPAVAMPGSEITIAGTYLSAAQVTLAGHPINSSVNSASEIRISIPSDAPNGPQQLTVTTTDGTDAGSVFVGREFQSGSLEDLAALGLPAGTAVLFGEGTFSASGEVNLGELSLYGQGPEKTTLVFPEADIGTLSNFVTLQVSVGSDVTIQDLHLVLGMFQIESVMNFALPASVQSAALEVFSVPEFSSLNVVESQALATGTVSLANITAESLPSATFAGIIISEKFPLAGFPEILPHATVFDQVTLRGDAMVVISAAADFKANDSQLDVGGFGVFSAGSVEIANSAMVASPSSSPGTFTPGQLFIVTGGPIRVSASELTANTAIDIGAGMIAPMPRPVIFEIIDSAINVPSITTELNDGFTLGQSGGLLKLHNTVFDIDGALEIWIEDLPGRIEMSKVTMALCNDSITSTDEPVVAIYSEGGGALLVTESDFTFHNGGYFLLEVDTDSADHPFTAHIDNNRFTGDAGASLVGLDLSYKDNQDQDLIIRARNNEFSGFDYGVAVSGPNAGPGQLIGELHHNVFNLDFSGGAKAARLENADPARVTIDASNNVWGSFTQDSEVEALVEPDATSQPEAFNVAPIAQP